MLDSESHGRNETVVVRQGAFYTVLDAFTMVKIL